MNTNRSSLENEILQYDQMIVLDQSNKQISINVITVKITSFVKLHGKNFGAAISVITSCVIKGLYFTVFVLKYVQLIFHHLILLLKQCSTVMSCLMSDLVSIHCISGVLGSNLVLGEYFCGDQA